MAEFFENLTPRQSLEKAKREFQRLTSDLSGDTISNFFVTAYHIKDSIIVHRSDLKKEVASLETNEDFKRCKYICNMEKHKKPDRNDKGKFITYKLPDAVYGQIGYNEAPFNSKLAYLIFNGVEDIEVRELGQRILDLWENFFKEHNI